MYLPQYSFNIQVGNVLYCNESTAVVILTTEQQTSSYSSCASLEKYLKNCRYIFIAAKSNILVYVLD